MPYQLHKNAPLHPYYALFHGCQGRGREFESRFPLVEQNEAQGTKSIESRFPLETRLSVIKNEARFILIRD